jgi:cytochrome c553
MKKTAGLLLVCAVAAAVMAQESPFQAVGSMSQLMINIIYPTSNAIFYVSRGAPKNQLEWNEMANSALTLAESGNLLMMPGRSRDNDKWVADAKLLVDVGAAAYKAAQAKDADALVALSDQLNTACVQCHMDYRPSYRKRK